jgi:hypothetical protein
MALMLSQPDAQPNMDEPMPHWGWGEVRPWTGEAEPAKDQTG